MPLQRGEVLGYDFLRLRYLKPLCGRRIIAASNAVSANSARVHHIRERSPR